MAQLTRVGVAGCGLMGSGIAEVLIRSGLDTLVYEVDDAAISAGRKKVEGSLARAVTSGKLGEAEREAHSADCASPPT